MHRKSAYILFVAVLGMLVIGIVMLFSTSAFARDSHGDVYFFIKRQGVWLAIGLTLCAVPARPVKLWPVFGGGLSGILLMAQQMSERTGRLLAFLAPQRFKGDAGLQQMQALIAWGSGGMEGLGLGNGRQKMLYLPYAPTDFI